MTEDKNVKNVVDIANTAIPILDPSNDVSKITDEVIDTVSTKTISYYINGGIYTDEPWFHPLLKTLNKVTDKDIINLYMNTYGGDVLAAFQIIATINRCKAPVNLYVEGLCASAGTMITFGGKFNSITIDKYTIFLFHNGFSVQIGKSNDALDSANFYMGHLDTFFNTVYKPVLTSSEIKEVLKGKELYLSGDEVNTRLESKPTRSKKK